MHTPRHTTMLYTVCIPWCVRGTKNNHQMTPTNELPCIPCLPIVFLHRYLSIFPSRRSNPPLDAHHHGKCTCVRVFISTSLYIDGHRSSIDCQSLKRQSISEKYLFFIYYLSEKIVLPTNQLNKRRIISDDHYLSKLS